GGSGPWTTSFGSGKRRCLVGEGPRAGASIPRRPKLCIVPAMAIDRITVSVIQHRLESIVQEMGEAMLRTAYSQILNSSRDFSTAVFDGQGRLAAHAEHAPIHMGDPPRGGGSGVGFL